MYGVRSGFISPFYSFACGYLTASVSFIKKASCLLPTCFWTFVRKQWSMSVWVCSCGFSPLSSQSVGLPSTDSTVVIPGSWRTDVSSEYSFSPRPSSSLLELKMTQCGVIFLRLQRLLIFWLCGICEFSPTRDWNLPPVVEARSLSRCRARKVPRCWVLSVPHRSPRLCYYYYFLCVFSLSGIDCILFLDSYMHWTLCCLPLSPSSEVCYLCYLHS